MTHTHEHIMNKTQPIFHILLLFIRFYLASGGATNLFGRHFALYPPSVMDDENMFCCVVWSVLSRVIVSNTFSWNKVVFINISMI